MDNKVGDKIPSEREIASLLEELAGIKARVAKWGVHLSAEERQVTAKLRAGADEHAQKIASLAKKHDVQIKGVPLDGMAADLQLVRAVRPVEQAIDELAQLVADTRLEATSEAAQAFFAYYGRLAQMAETDAELEAELAPVVTALSTGRRKK